ncbi:amino acid adenylation domain-containing protein [Pseudomonas sp. FP1740]|uniref:non-ribosomal peptide synthetase n=1 Tax=Pseudomonas sp. FP1740 TaxID=2954078 RepID=UPI0027346DEE|nr:amino acid adenylation domain-containing protein [Pseudomonas sp. FP1740]WLG45799.1 amino acid adenylation domain-containing protein [Pseudomonas sp. FP1740]
MSELLFPPDSVTETQVFLDLWRQSSHDYRNAPAIDSGGILYSYVDIDAQSNQVAAYLVQNGIGAGAIVAVGCPRGKDLLIAMLGVMKSGATFFLFELDAAPTRLSVQFEMARPVRVLVSDADALTANCAFAGVDVVTLGKVLESAQPLHFAAPGVSSDDLAYIIFTSGSTGQPKGVLVPHRGIPNLARHALTYGISKGSRVLMFSPVCFDAIIAEIAMTLFAGGCLVAVADHELRDFDSLQNLLCHRQIDVVTLPPSLVSLLPIDLPISLSTLVVAGERCSKEVIANWASKTRLLNAYGPSEATVATTVKLCCAETSPANIGRALSNVTVHILSEQMEEVGDGEVGEIYISGGGVAHGYLGLADLSAARFFGGAEGVPGRTFRTGDFARRNADGDILFEGRQDDLVKVNGNRVELAEIEACAMASSLVQSCHACSTDAGASGVRIALFIVPSNGTEAVAVESALREKIARDLPNYFMPARILVRDELPRNPAGKIDRAALVAQLDVLQESIAPAGAMTRQEETLALIWAQILDRPVEDREANFFALGGNSLLAMRLVALMKRHNIQIPLKRVFGAPTLSQMACLIGE